MSELSDLLSQASNAAASWYNATSFGTPVITSTSVAAANQLALNQQAQANLNATNPLLAGILANPGSLILILLAIGAAIFLVVWLTRK